MLRNVLAPAPKSMQTPLNVWNLALRAIFIFNHHLFPKGEHFMKNPYRIWVTPNKNTSAPFVRIMLAFFKLLLSRKVICKDNITNTITMVTWPPDFQRTCTTPLVDIAGYISKKTKSYQLDLMVLLFVSKNLNFHSTQLKRYSQKQHSKNTFFVLSWD